VFGNATIPDHCGYGLQLPADSPDRPRIFINAHRSYPNTSHDYAGLKIIVGFQRSSGDDQVHAAPIRSRLDST
jgi:hypothetical protein